MTYEDQKLEYKVHLSKNLLEFAEVMMDNAVKASFGEMHYRMAEKLTDLNIEFLNLVAPRGHGKSTIGCVATVLWHVFLEDYLRMSLGLPRRINLATNRPEHCNVIIISKTMTDSMERIASIKEVLNKSLNFRALFGDYSEAKCKELGKSRDEGDKFTWTKDRIHLWNDTLIRGMGMGQNLHGRNHNNVRPTLYVFDDPEDTENTKTMESKRANMNVMTTNAIPGRYLRFGRIVCIGTPLDTSCMVVALHEAWGSRMNKKNHASVWFKHSLAEKKSWYSLPSWEAKKLEGLGEDVIKDHYGYWHEKKGLLWQSWVDEKVLDDAKQSIKKNRQVSVGQYHRQWECQVVGDEEQIFEPKWFENTWAGDVVWRNNRSYLEIYRLGEEVYDEPFYLHVGISAGYDAAYTINKTSSWSTACALATDKDDRRFELPGLRIKAFFAELQPKFLQFQSLRKPLVSMMEANGPQVATFEMMAKAGLRVRKDANIFDKKVERVSTLQEPMANGKFFFQEGTYAADEAFSFPRGSIDYLDAMEKANRCRRKGTNMRYIGQEDKGNESIDDYLKNFVTPMTV